MQRVFFSHMLSLCVRQGLRCMAMEKQFEDWHFLVDSAGMRVRHNLGLPGTMMYGRDSQIRLKVLLTKRLPQTRDDYCGTLQRSVRCMQARHKMAAAKRAKLEMMQRTNRMPTMRSNLEVDVVWQAYCDACTANMTHPIREFKSQISGGDISLKSYTLSHNGVVSISSMVQGMASMSILQTLRLSDNNIRGNGVRALADALGANVTNKLQALYLDKNPVTCEGNDVMTMNTADSRVGRGSTGCKALSDIMTSSTALTLLSLSHCGIGNAGITTLAQNVADHPSLTSLRLDYNNSKPAAEMYDAAFALGEMLSQSYTLMEFFYGGNSLLGKDAHALLGGARDLSLYHGILQTQTLRRLHLQVGLYVCMCVCVCVCVRVCIVCM
jgi:hypothetical protein